MKFSVRPSFHHPLFVASIIQYSFRDPEHLLGRLQWAHEPEGTPGTVGRVSVSRACLGEPVEVHGSGLGAVDRDVAVPVVWLSLPDTDRLVPAMLARDRVGVYRVREVLVHEIRLESASSDS